MSNEEKSKTKRRIISSKSKSKSEPPEEKKSIRRPLPRPNETEEEAIIRRYHDAQRMARFRARRKKALEESRALQAEKLTKLALIAELKKRNILFHVADNFLSQDDSDTVTIVPLVGDCKYSQLLTIIQEIGKDIKLTYAGSRNSIDKLKSEIVQAKLLVRDCILEAEANSRH